jgi:hypothetical protein
LESGAKPITYDRRNGAVSTRAWNLGLIAPVAIPDEIGRSSALPKRELEDDRGTTALLFAVLLRAGDRQSRATE